MKKTNLQPLYKLDSKGNTRVWEVTTDGPVVVARYGILGGKMQETRVDAVAKNIGRANETTAEEQAILDAESQWRDKSVKYNRIKPGNKSYVQVLTPMLAKRFGKVSINYPIDVQPKLDGYRCLAKIDGNNDITLISRSGKPFALTHIETDLEKLPVKNCYLDGELYLHGKNFQQVSRLIKRKDTSIVFHIYDYVSGRSDTTSWKNRRRILEGILKGNALPNLKLVETKQLKKEDQLCPILSGYISEKYEGAILRDLDSPYKFNSKSSGLIKVKLRDDDEFLVVDVAMATQGRAKGGAIFVCQNNIANNTFRCSMKNENKKESTFEMRRQQYKNRDQYIGRMLTVEYFGRSDDDIPREAVAKAFRETIDIDPNQ